jgi:hypothetical protein
MGHSPWQYCSCMDVRYRMISCNFDSYLSTIYRLKLAGKYAPPEAEQPMEETKEHAHGSEAASQKASDEK